jgi:hypothetical protein
MKLPKAFQTKRFNKITHRIEQNSPHPNLAGQNWKTETKAIHQIPRRWLPSTGLLLVAGVVSSLIRVKEFHTKAEEHGKITQTVVSGGAKSQKDATHLMEKFESTHSQFFQGNI